MAASPEERKVWVLDTETKGTGAHVAPMRNSPPSARTEQPLSLVELGPPDGARGASSAPEPQPRAPLRFRVLDVMSSRVLVEDVGAHEAVAALERVPRAVDALVFVRSGPQGRWRLLSIEERRRLWAFRGRLADGARERAGAADR
ncbi:MAG TPA: hypothetical protein VFW29_12510 [Solirubrobacteraceae bacterium]|nr:hypothetical protein [Solirubrobacteraceae bacterium]